MLGRPRPSTSDLLVAGVVLLVAIFGVFVAPQEAGVSAIVLSAAQAAPLAYRRRAPVPVLGIVLAATALYFLLDNPLVTTAFAGLVVATYGVAAFGTDRQARIGLMSTVAALFALFGLGVIAGRNVTIMDAGVHAALLGIAWVLGDRAKTRQAYTRSLEQRANELEHRRRIEAAAAVAQERTRIARDLHDIVAHAVSTMVLHSGAAKLVLDLDPEGARRSLDLIEDAGRQAIAELRAILQVLHTDEDQPDEGLRPQPGISDVPQLVERAREAGIEVEFKVEGEERPLPRGVEISVYRIAQEALTNVMKHSGARRAEVAVRFDRDRLVLQIVDDGRTPEPTTSGGYGLAGMRERVALLGGTIDARQRRQGGFEVLAVLPLQGAEG